MTGNSVDRLSADFLGDLMDQADVNTERKMERRAFLFLTVILAPALSVALVGGLGFSIWIYQMIAGPPGS